MRTVMLGIAVAVFALAGCAAPQRAAKFHCVLQMTIRAEGMGQDGSTGHLAPLMHVDARLVRTAVDVEADLLDLRERREVMTVNAPQITLAVGQDGRVAVTVNAEPAAFSIVDTRNEPYVVGRVHGDATLLRVVVKDFDEGTRTGHVSFEMANQTDGQIDAYFTAEDREFREGETLLFEPTSPEWPEAASCCAGAIPEAQ